MSPEFLDSVWETNIGIFFGFDFRSLQESHKIHGRIETLRDSWPCSQMGAAKIGSNIRMLLRILTVFSTGGAAERSRAVTGDDEAKTLCRDELEILFADMLRRPVDLA